MQGALRVPRIPRALWPGAWCSWRGPSGRGAAVSDSRWGCTRWRFPFVCSSPTYWAWGSPLAKGSRSRKPSGPPGGSWRSGGCKSWAPGSCVCICACVYMQIYLCLCMYTCGYEYICIHMCGHVYMCIYVHMCIAHIGICVCLCVRHACLPVCMSTCVCMPICVYMQVHTRMCEHVCTCARV